jgi:hypothetical protein
LIDSHFLVELLQLLDFLIVQFAGKGIADLNLAPFMVYNEIDLRKHCCFGLCNRQKCI